MATDLQTLDRHDNRLRLASWIGPITWLLFGLVCFFALARSLGKDESFQDPDFGAYYRGGTALAKGMTPYRIDEFGPDRAFVYSPAFACLFRQFNFLDYLWACRVWTVLNFLTSAICFALVLQLVFGNDRQSKLVWGTVWLGMLPLASYYWNNLRAGQAAPVMLALCFGWAVCQRHGRPFLGGMLLAAAIAVKLAPVILLPYLVIRRDWRGLGGVVVGGLACLALPMIWFGWEGTLPLHRDWINFCQQTQNNAQTCRQENQSLLGQLARLPAFSNGGTFYSLSNLQTLQRVYPLIVAGLAAVIYGCIFWNRRRNRDVIPLKAEHFRDNLHLAVLFTLMTLVHPRAWTCNFVALTLACLLLAERVCRRASGWRSALVAMGIVVLTCASPKPSIVSSDWSLATWILQGKDFWAAMALTSVCCWLTSDHVPRQTQQAQT